jgi:hypothetical protein
VAKRRGSDEAVETAAVADSFEAVAAHEAVQNDNEQAEISGEVGDASGDGVLDKNAVADGPTKEEVEAANKARLARGEEPVAEAGDDQLPAEPEEGSAEEEEMRIRNTAGEDTMAVRQSNVDRVVDGEIVRAEQNVSTMGTSRDA